MSDDVYFFDCDKTLYAFDFRRRLPRLAELTGASQYHLVGGLGGNGLVSAVLGARTPERRIYTRVLGRFGVEGQNALLIDDSAANLLGAASTGMHAFQLIPDPQPGQPERYTTVEIMDALRAFAAR